MSQRTQKYPLVMTILVRDEADIIGQNIAFHLDQGVDHIIVMDNGSVDGTRAVLEPFAADRKITILDEPSQDYLQDVWMTRMAVMARETFGAEWIICNDADEFWWSPTGNLKDALPPLDGHETMLTCVRHQMIGPRDALDHTDWRQALTYRPATPPTFPEIPNDLVGIAELELDHPLFYYQLHGKMIFPAQGLQYVVRGAHTGHYDRTLPNPAACEVEIFHFPIRSRVELQRSVQRIESAVARTPGVAIQTSWKYRRWQYMAERANSIWPAFCDALPDRKRVMRDLANGYLVEEPVILQLLDRIMPQPTADTVSPEAAPPVPLLQDNTVGDLVLVMGAEENAANTVADFLQKLGAPGGRPDAGPSDLLLDAHRAILSEMERAALDFRDPPPEWFKGTSAKSWHVTVMELLLAQHADLDFAVLCDPTLDALLPLWRDVAKANYLGLHVALVLDNPLTAAKRIQQQMGIPVEVGALLWARRIIRMERESRDLPRHIVEIADMTSDWEAAADRFLRAIKPQWPRAHRADGDDINAALQGSVAAFAHSEADVMHAAQVPDVVKETYDVLRALAVNDRMPELHARLSSIAKEIERTTRYLHHVLGTAKLARDAGLSIAHPSPLNRSQAQIDRLTLPVVSAESTVQPVKDDSPSMTRRELLDKSRARLLEKDTHGVRGTFDKNAKGLPKTSAILIAAIKDAPEFDPAWYQTTYPDVAESGADPALHYLHVGAFECRNPGPDFDTLRYYEANPDVLEAGMFAFIHFIRFGRAGNRAIFPAEPLPG
ncbi:glycosyltransferase family 2 protein [Sulfitobacter albidus]|uniref:Glycosyltransferase family 2 protein n=1 Tax=Sulfitobacter albidus TaxID=2829501 RepID=A0A975PNC7_9RHOB|nr:glycosyltransferase family 2 protein [Sulfitobacter albidus]QUJ77331.1 glycosyltransferase family 2 protein [Sulfitobacter albidus]